MTGAFCGTQCPYDVCKRLPAHRWIEPLRGHPTQRQHDLWLHQRDLTIQVHPAEPNLPRGGRTVTLPTVPRRTGEALGKTRQVEVAVKCALREAGPRQPGLERLTRGSPVWLSRRVRTRSWRLPYHHQSLSGVALEDRVSCRDETRRHTASAGRDFLLQEDEGDLVIQERRFVRH